MKRTEAGVWPLLRDVQAPWHPAWPQDDLGFADHLTCPIVEHQGRETYVPAALALQARLDALARGATYDVDELDALATAAAIPLRPSTDRRPVLSAPRVLSEPEIGLEVLDSFPDAGQRALDELLGPWALALRLPQDRRILVFALAQWALAGPERSPIERWTRSRSRPPAPVRACARAMWQAPLGLWRLRLEAGRWWAEDQVGLDPRRVPREPVGVSTDRPVQDGAVVLARAVPVGSGGWRLFGGLVLRHAPSPERVRRHLHVGLVRMRLRHRRGSLEDVLRDQGRWFARQILMDDFIDSAGRTRATGE